MAIHINKSHAFWRSKLITDPAVLKMKQTIEPKRPGRVAAILLPRVLEPFPTPFVTDFRPFSSAPTITAIVFPTARTTAETVKPYFLNIFLNLSLSEVPCSSSLSFSSASIRCCSFSCSFSSSYSFVFILITSNPPILLNRLLPLFNFAIRVFICFASDEIVLRHERRSSARNQQEIFRLKEC